MKVPTSYPDRRWQRVLRSLALAVALAGGLLVPGDGQTAAADTPTAQHQAIQNQITTHDGNQTSQHNGLSGQATTHDSAQTSQHNTLSQKIDNLSTGADHRGLPQAWDKVLPADDGTVLCHSSRFTCVMGNAAVRDNETGLVWEQSPNVPAITWDGSRIDNARIECTTRTTGGRKGWRLPSIPELASLVDPSVVFPGPALPAGHPFINVQSGVYWSATTDADLPTNAWSVDFSASLVRIFEKTGLLHVWCVRGAMNADQY